MWRCEYYATLTLWRISCECKTFIFAAYSPEMIRLPRRITEKGRPFKWLRMLPNFIRIPANVLRSLRSVCRISGESFANVKTTVEPHLTVTSLNQSPLHSGHPGSDPNDFPWKKNRTLVPVIWSPPSHQ